MTGARYRASLRWGQRLTAWTVIASSPAEAARLAEADPQVAEWGPDAVLTVTPCEAPAERYGPPLFALWTTFRKGARATLWSAFMYPEAAERQAAALRAKGYGYTVETAPPNPARFIGMTRADVRALAGA